MSASAFVIPLGQYKGKDIEDVPSNYLRWVAEKFDEKRHPPFIKAADAELKFRTRTHSHFED